jgi:hypothetical protein
MRAQALRTIPLAEQPDAHVLAMRAMALLQQMPEVPFTLQKGTEVLNN